MSFFDQIKFIFILLLFLCNLTISKSAISNENHSYTILTGVSVLNFGYKEFNTNDDMLDREDGYIPGLTFTVSRNWQQWAANITINYLSGTIDYNGQTGNGIPVISKTDIKILDYSFSLDYWTATKNNMSYAIYAGYGQHEWQRNIRSTTKANGFPVSGLNEKYYWNYLLVGTKLEIIKTQKILWKIDIQYNHMMDAKIDVNFPGFDPVTLNLGTEWGLRLSSPYQIKFNNQLFIELEPYYEYWEISRSESKLLMKNSVETNVRIIEPRSETQNMGFNLSLIKKF